MVVDRVKNKRNFEIFASFNKPSIARRRYSGITRRIYLEVMLFKKKLSKKIGNITAKINNIFLLSLIEIKTPYRKKKNTSGVVAVIINSPASRRFWPIFWGFSTI